MSIFFTKPTLRPNQLRTHDLIKLPQNTLIRLHCSAYPNSYPNPFIFENIIKGNLRFQYRRITSWTLSDTHLSDHACHPYTNKTWNQINWIENLEPQFPFLGKRVFKLNTKMVGSRPRKYRHYERLCAQSIWKILKQKPQQITIYLYHNPQSQSLPNFIPIQLQITDFGRFFINYSRSTKNKSRLKGQLERQVVFDNFPKVKNILKDGKIHRFAVLIRPGGENG